MSVVPPPHPAASYKEPLAVRVGRYSGSTLILLVVLVVVYTLVWFGTAMMLRSSVQDWFSARQAEGYQAEYDDAQARISGFPFHVKATISDVVLSPPRGSSGRLPWVWTPEQVTFKIVPMPWSLRTLHIEVPAKQGLKIAGYAYEGRAKQMKLSVDWLSPGLPAEAVLKVQGLNLKDRSKKKAYTIRHLGAHGERTDTGGYAYDISAQDMDLPGLPAGLPQRVSDILLRGEFDGAFGQQDWGAEELIRWRDDGGVLQAERTQIEYGPLFLQGNGTMALDGELQPVGAFSARIQGFFEMVQMLQENGVIKGPDASMAKVVLGMLAKPSKNGGPASIGLALTLQDGALYAGPVRLIAIPKIDW